LPRGALAGSKVGQVFLAPMCPVTDISEFITDDSADPEKLEAIRRCGPEVIVVPAGPEP
jgi:DeoR/GlpR family transcriptional regulator of sugar metabolism